MICLMFFAICFLASVAGAICGIGGGVIIKPVLDAFGILDVNVISFLSGCTVLSMTTYSVVKSRMSRESHVETAVGTPLALGAAAGGLAGKQLFSWVLSISPDKDQAGAVQACCLLIVTVGTSTWWFCSTFFPCRRKRQQKIRCILSFFHSLPVLLPLL